ncbi:MAG: ABC transporter substrate-binding protein [Spirochaetaceae bacterium]|nr:ABC transporter substrate-binding protein [Spirochaetaceae bacterium]
MKKRVSLLVLSAIFFACNSSASFNGTTFVFASNSFADNTLDPLLSLNNETTSRIVFTALYEGLLRRDQAGNIIPAIAESWHINDSHTTFTFSLRPNLSFSNGQPINMRMIILNFTQWIRGWEAFPTIQIIDELTFSIHFNRPFRGCGNDVCNGGLSFI